MASTAPGFSHCFLSIEPTTNVAFGDMRISGLSIIAWICCSTLKCKGPRFNMFMLCLQIWHMYVWDMASAYNARTASLVSVGGSCKALYKFFSMFVNPGVFFCIPHKLTKFQEF